MNSMTGYGRATAALGRTEITVQVHAVNRRSLDLSVSLPDAWRELESELAARVRETAARGKVTLSIEAARAGAAGEPAWDDAAVERALERVRALAGRHGSPAPVSAELVWSIAASLRDPGLLPPPAEAGPVVREAVGRALADFAAMRSREGAALQADLLARAANVAGHVAAIAERAPAVTVAYREGLLQRLRQAGLELELSDERVLREIALFADRSDITEELTRLRSHLDQLGALLRESGEVGRKAEFLLQEIGREVNTIGSKANDLEIARRVIEAKNELERIREQVANVE